jgi:hypothetical protein
MTKNVEQVVDFPEEALAVTAITLEGEEKPTELLAPPTQFPIGEYDNYLAKAQKLSSYNATVSIASKYLEFSKPGETVRGVFLGFTTINKRDDNGELKSITVVQWLAPDGALYINGGVALVRTFEEFNVPKGSPIEITYEGKRDRTKIFDVRILG